MLFRKKIILGVTGSIAAYKSAALTRLLVKAGAEVKVIMTESSKGFVTPLTLSTLSKNPVHSSFITGEDGTWVNHVDLGIWADLFIIAPASANILAHCSNGICESLLSAVYLSARCPVFFAPAMDLDMWKHPSTISNVNKLISYGNKIISPVSGELASGLVGEGRMAEPEDILAQLENFFSVQHQLSGKKILITAGPTRETIDPVRYISNHSSGKMGYELAKEFASRGAAVTLISGPVSLKAPNGVELISVETAQQMYQETTERFSKADAAILTSAVADFRPSVVSDQKIKKSSEISAIELEPTLDILAQLGKSKSNQQILGGFALETQNGRAAAEQKLKNKELDFIALNELSAENPVFGSDLNQIEILTKDGQWNSYPRTTKSEAARILANLVNDFFKNA
jgi:phosphopantothenoylcysteine decarboxylase/phosphopantothenate--cysteine ligase